MPLIIPSNSQSASGFTIGQSIRFNQVVEQLGHLVGGGKEVIYPVQQMAQTKGNLFLEQQHFQFYQTITLHKLMV